MTEKILFVDDEVNVLAGYERTLRRRFTIETSESGEKGLEMIKRSGPYAVIVADMRMPQMDGIQFLSRVCTLTPNSVRMMLTGNADQQTAIDAVNEGRIFRFLTKPCDPGVLEKALLTGIEQYRLVTAEAELLEKTLTGSIKVLTDILAMADPKAFGRAIKLREYVREVLKELKVRNGWQIELAAMLSQIGQMAVPVEVLTKLRAGTPLTDPETEIMIRVPEIGQTLLSKIPRLDTVAQIVLYQDT